MKLRLLLIVLLVTISTLATNLLVAVHAESLNLIGNNSFESKGGWSEVQYGTESAVFVMQSSDAHSGSFGASVTNTDDEAEVGYVTSVISPSANQRYSLSFWQKGDTYAYAYLTYLQKDGSTTYDSLMSVPATNGEWSRYSDAFITPANVKSMQITIATSGVGSLVFDDVMLTPMQNQSPNVFSGGMVSLTFDDGSSSTYTNGFSVLKQYGYKGTFYLNAGVIGKTNFMTKAQVRALASGGQEIGSHLYHHSDMVQIDTPTLESELQGNIDSLKFILGNSSYPITNFASPYGSFTSGKVDTVMQFEASHRDTDGEMNTKANFDVRQIHALLVTSGTTLTQLKIWLAEAKAQHAWLVLVYHTITTSRSIQALEGDGYSVTPTAFNQQIAAVKASGLPVQTVSDAIRTLGTQ